MTDTGPGDSARTRRRLVALGPPSKTVLFALGVLAIYGTLRWLMAIDESRRGYLDSYGFRLWTAMVAGSAAIWILLAKLGIDEVRQLGKGAAARWWTYVSCLVIFILAMASLQLLVGKDRLFPVPLNGWIWKALIPIGGGTIAGAPWIISVWLAHERLHAVGELLQSDAGNGDDAQIEGTTTQLLRLWTNIEHAIIALTAIVITSVVTTGTLRESLVAFNGEDDAPPATDVLAQGGYFAVLIAIAVLPLIAAYQNQAGKLLDATYPRSFKMGEEDAGARKRLAHTLHIDVPLLRSPLAALGVLAPLLTSALTVYIPQLGH
jgi:hypothetical protein